MSIYILSLGRIIAPSPTIPPFQSLSSLSASNPYLRVLDLALNYRPYGFPMISLAPAPSDYIFTNIFPYLVHFSIRGMPAPPRNELLSSFLVAHPSLRHVALHAEYPFYDHPPPQFPPGILPSLESLEGSPQFCAAICDAGPPRMTVTVLHGIHTLIPNVSEMYIHSVIPKLPSLRHATMRFTGPVSPEWLATLGSSCPQLETLQLNDPQWVGDKVCRPRSLQVQPTLMYIVDFSMNSNRHSAPSRI